MLLSSGLPGQPLAQEHLNPCPLKSESIQPPLTLLALLTAPPRSLSLPCPKARSSPLAAHAATAVLTGFLAPHSLFTPVQVPGTLHSSVSEHFRLAAGPAASAHSASGAASPQGSLPRAPALGPTISLPLSPCPSWSPSAKMQLRGRTGSTPNSPGPKAHHPAPRCSSVRFGKVQHVVTKSRREIMRTLRRHMLCTVDSHSHRRSPASPDPAWKLRNGPGQACLLGGGSRAGVGLPGRWKQDCSGCPSACQREAQPLSPGSELPALD